VRLVDPACGNGVFLLAAYRFMLTWYSTWYNTPYLPFAERRRILLEHIYGVDRDMQAVDAARHALRLALLHNHAPPGERVDTEPCVLPRLDTTILCGDALIGPDISTEQLSSSSSSSSSTCHSIPDETASDTLTPLDWATAFPTIQQQGGFDIVIGNPPWVFTRNVAFGPQLKSYYARHYTSARGKINLCALFVERGLHLLNPQGMLAMILPNTILRSTTYAHLREHMVQQYHILKITDAGAGVFPGVTAPSIILLATRKHKHAASAEPEPEPMQVATLQPAGHEEPRHCIAPAHILANPGCVIDLYADGAGRALLAQVAQQCQPLAACVTHLMTGIQTWKQHKHAFIADRPLDDEYKPLLEGKDIGRYTLTFRQKYIWYNAAVLNVMQNEEVFLLPEKIVIQRISGGACPLKATLDRNGFYCYNSLNTLVCHSLDQRYILGLLNSRFLNWLYSIRFSNRSKLTVNIAIKNLRQLPVPVVNMSHPTERARYQSLVEHVEQMLTLHAQAKQAHTAAQHAALQQHIAHTDWQIDQLVYALYGLDEKAIRMVEQATGS
jgi:hypothetical protein